MGHKRTALTLGSVARKVHIPFSGCAFETACKSPLGPSQAHFMWIFLPHPSPPLWMLYNLRGNVCSILPSLRFTFVNMFRMWLGKGWTELFHHLLWLATHFSKFEITYLDTQAEAGMGRNWYSSLRTFLNRIHWQNHRHSESWKFYSIKQCLPTEVEAITTAALLIWPS